jgi:ABC-type transport system substrate-binding protein
MKRSLLLGVLAAIFVAGCSKGNFSEKASEGKENIFRYPIAELTKLDPAVVQDGDTIDVVQQIFEGLVQWDENSRVAPNLAESWDLTDGGKTYVFHLKKGVKFSNGKELTADDVKFSFERVCDPAIKSPNAKTYFNDIVGAVDKVDGKAKEVSGVKVIDPHTVSITIDKPRPYFLGKLNYISAAIVSKDAVPAGQEITSVDKMIGTGAFIADKYTPGQIFTMKANPNYHGGKPSIDGIERPILIDAATRLNKFKSGELDLVQLERQDIEGLRKDAKLADQIKTFSRPVLFYVGLNVKEYPPFAKRDVRRAFAMAINKKRIVDELLGGQNEIANGILPPGVLGYRDNAAAIGYDLEGAKKLLASAGYPGGKGLPPVKIYFRDGRPDIRIVADAVATDLNTGLGTQITLQARPWTQYLDEHTKNNHEFFHMRWGADYLDPENFLSVLLASYGNENHIYYKNDAYDALTRAGDVEHDEKRRLELYAQAEDLVLQDAPFIPIYFQKDAELISPRVQGLRESLFGHLPHTGVKLTR